MKKSILYTLCFCAFPTLADTSITVTGVSDYLFNGVSQTQEDPAIQACFDWAGDTGWYAGVWGSNVDFGEDTLHFKVHDVTLEFKDGTPYVPIFQFGSRERAGVPEVFWKNSDRPNIVGEDDYVVDLRTSKVSKETRSVFGW